MNLLVIVVLLNLRDIGYLSICVLLDSGDTSRAATFKGERSYMYVGVWKISGEGMNSISSSSTLSFICAKGGSC